MTRQLVTLSLICLISSVVFGAGAARQTLLRDGFALGGVDGKIVGPDSNDIWLFKLASDVSDDRVVIKKGISLQLLPSATLERITADVKERSSRDYQLWGTVTKYKGRNYIFPTFFLALSKTKEPQPQISQPQVTEPNETPPAGEQKRESTINEPDDILAVPQEILQKLEAREIETSSRPSIETIESSMKSSSGQSSAQGFGRADTVVVNRTGFISSPGMRDSYRSGRMNQYGFVFDALGRKIPKMSFRLLPCEALELAEQKQSVELEDMKFKIAGIVTKYKDQNYLLLQKATRVYSYGNFAR